MSDADEPEPAICDTLGCENESVEGGYWPVCADISLGIPDSDDGDANNDTLEERHRASNVSLGHDEPESEPDASANSGSDSPVEGGSDNANPDPDFEVNDPTTCNHSGHEQSQTAVATPQRATDERGRRGNER